MTWPALRWWRRTAFALLALTSAVVAYQWSYVDRPPTEERFELAPVDSGAVDAEWRAMPTVATVSYAGPEYLDHATLPLGPFRLVDVEDGIYFSDADLLIRQVRLCDPSDCDGSAVVLRPKPVPLRLRRGNIPDGTWRLRHDPSKGQWLVSYAPPEDAGGPEDLVVAVLRVPVPLGVQRPPDALVCLLGAGFLALSISLWNTLRARRAWSIGEGDDVLTGALLALVIASALGAARSTGRVEPAWDLEVREAVRPPDWRSWPRVDLVHGPFTSPDYFFQWLDARAAMLGSLELQSRVNLDRMPPYEEEVDARVCSAHSCVRVDPPPEDPWVFVVGLVHVPGSELWAVTFADEKHGEHAVSVPWLRVPHVALAQRMPWLPWACLGIAGLSLLLDLLSDRSERRTRVVDVDRERMSVLPSALRVSRILAPLGVVASGFSLASLVGGRAEGPIAVAGLVVAILAMAAAWLLRRPWRAPAASGPNEGERRAQIVGVGAVVVSLVGLILQLGRLAAAHAEPFAGTLLARALAETGLLAGAAAIVTVRVRRWRRRAFIARVRAGKVPGYRVAANGARPALLRASADNAGYRAAEQEVYVFEKAP